MLLLELLEKSDRLRLAATITSTAYYTYYEYSSSSYGHLLYIECIKLRQRNAIYLSADVEHYSRDFPLAMDDEIWANIYHAWLRLPI